MPGAQRRCLWRSLSLAVATYAAAYSAADVKESSAFVKDAEQYFASGNLEAAEIELKNAVRQSPKDPAIHLRLAEVYLRLGDAASAEREARAVRELNADEADYLPIFADALVSQKKFKDLFELIEPADRNPVLESKVRTALGTAAAGLHYDEKAEAFLRDAIRLDPSAVEPGIQLARFLNGSKREAAERVINDAIAANPQSAELRRVKGEMLWSHGDSNAAVHLFDEALKIDPSYPLAHLSRANVNVARGEFKAADEDLDPLLQAIPDNFTANYLRALEQVKQQQYVAADRTLERISSNFPAFPAGYFLRAVTKLALGQLEFGEGLLETYLNRVSRDPEATRLIATAALQQHGAPRAIDYLTSLVDKLPSDSKTLTLLGNAYMADGKPELALKQFEKAAALDPENKKIKTRVAIAEIGSDQGPRGLEELERVFADEAGAAVAGPTLVLAELHAGHVDKAAEVAASLIKRDVDNPLYQRLLGKVRVAQRDDDGAETAFRTVLPRSREFAAASRDLAELYARTARNGDAKKVYADLLLRKATDTTALLGLSDIAIAEKKWSEAVDLLNRARAANKFDPTAALKLVHLYEQRRDWKSAKAVATELYALFPRNVNIVVALGWARLGSGDTNAAISAYKLAHQLTPNSVPIRSSYIALLKQAKYFREARDVLQEAVIRDPQNASLKADLIRADVEVDGVDGAVSRAREFAASEPDNNLYHLVSAELYEKAGRTGDAAALLEKALAARPSDDDLAVALARLYTRMGDFGKAETLLTGRLQADRDNIAAGSALAPLYLIAGRPDDAKKIYDAVLSRKPDDVAALIGLAYVAVAEQQWPQAMDYSKRARRAAPDDPIPGLRLVNLYTFRRDWKNAIATAAELAEQFPTNGDVMELQARAQIGTGDIDGAISTYERAHEIAPDSLPILSGYVDLLRSAKKNPEAWTLLQAALDRDPGTPIARADLLFGPTSPDSAISPFPAPYAPVDANLTTSATATATSTSVDSGADSFLMGGGGSVDVNVNAASFTIGSISRTPLSANFDPPLLRNSGAKNVDGFGTLNLTIDGSDDFKNAMNSISFVITNTGGTWTTPNDVLTPNDTPK
jgi:cellulose synthase operon protein C